MSNTDFSADSLFVADLGYYGEQQAGQRIGKEVTDQTRGIASSKDASSIPDVECSKHATMHYQSQKTVSGSGEYGTTRGARRNTSWMSMLTAMGSIMGGLMRSGRASTVGDAQAAYGKEERMESGNSAENKMLTKDNDGTKGAAEAMNLFEEEKLKTLGPPLRVSDWKPQCPYCARPNEYGRTMCDPVLPRICQDASLGDNEGASSQRERRGQIERSAGKPDGIPIFF